MFILRQITWVSSLAPLPPGGSNLTGPWWGPWRGPWLGVCLWFIDGCLPSLVILLTILTPHPFYFQYSIVILSTLQESPVFGSMPQVFYRTLQYAAVFCSILQ